VVALKTGTTNDSRDAWTIGYTPTVAVGAWMGNNDNSPMSQIASALIVSPMWKEYMDYILTKVNKEDFAQPDEASSDTKPFLKGIYQTADGVSHSELYWVDREDITGPAPTNPTKDPSFYNWERSVYAGSEGAGFPTINDGSIRININGSNSNISRKENLAVSLGGYDDQTTKVEYLINGTRVGDAALPPYSSNISLALVGNINPENEVRAVEYRKDGKTRSTSVYFTVRD
jgi:membrane peptidoglycan carboxypeptidase